MAWWLSFKYKPHTGSDKKIYYYQQDSTDPMGVEKYNSICWLLTFITKQVCYAPSLRQHITLSVEGNRVLDTGERRLPSRHLVLSVPLGVALFRRCHAGSLYRSAPVSLNGSPRTLSKEACLQSEWRLSGRVRERDRQQQNRRSCLRAR